VGCLAKFRTVGMAVVVVMMLSTTLLRSVSDDQGCKSKPKFRERYKISRLVFPSFPSIPHKRGMLQILKHGSHLLNVVGCVCLLVIKIKLRMDLVSTRKFVCCESPRSTSPGDMMMMRSITSLLGLS
jgi:hypothetical protein